MTTDIFCFYLQNRLFQPGQTGGQWYSDTSPLSIPRLGPKLCLCLCLGGTPVVLACPRVDIIFVHLPCPLNNIIFQLHLE
jgi:hypothetical protein